ncbi:unnamed protein product, partial [Amoebophrya sp. A120]
ADNNAFIQQLKHFDKDNIQPNVLKKLEQYVKKPEYQPDVVGNQSKACKSLCLWTHAIHTYSVVAKEVEPKKEKVKIMNVELENANSILQDKQGKLKQVLDEVNALQEKLSKMEREKEKLINESLLTEKRLERA